MNEDNTFFNFPIKLMQGVLAGRTTKIEFINHATKYGAYWYSEKILSNAEIEYDETDLDRFKRACSKILKVRFADFSEALMTGNLLRSRYSNCNVFVGVSTQALSAFYDAERKTEFEWECLLVFIALKSIIGKKDSVRTTNEMMYCRMHGKENLKEFREMKNPVKFTRYKRDKIILELQLNWGLKYYADGVKGFWISFDQEKGLNNITFKAESIKKKNKIKRLQMEKELAKQSAIQSLKGNSIISAP